MKEDQGYLAAQHDVALVDLVDRLLAGGVVISGDITLSLADVDLVYLNLRLVIASATTMLGEGEEATGSARTVPDLRRSATRNESPP